MGHSAGRILAELALRTIAAHTSDPWARRQAEYVLEALGEPQWVEVELPNGRRQRAQLAPELR